MLSIKIGNEPTAVFPIDAGTVTVGRRKDNHIVLKDRFISSYHAEFRRLSDGTYEIVDRESFNGTFVNGERVTRAKVKAGDNLKIGTIPARLILEEGVVEDAPSVRAPLQLRPPVDFHEGNSPDLKFRSSSPAPELPLSSGNIESRMGNLQAPPSQNSLVRINNLEPPRTSAPPRHEDFEARSAAPQDFMRRDPSDQNFINHEPPKMPLLPLERGNELSHGVSHREGGDRLHQLESELANAKAELAKARHQDPYSDRESHSQAPDAYQNRESRESEPLRREQREFDERTRSAEEELAELRRKHASSQAGRDRVQGQSFEPEKPRGHYELHSQLHGGSGSSLDGRDPELRQELERQGQTQRNLENEKYALNEALTKAREDADRLRQEKSALEARTSEMRHDIENLHHLRAELERARQEIANKNAAISERDAHIAQLATDTESRRYEVTNLGQEVATQTQIISGKEAELNQTRRLLQTREEELQKLREEIAGLYRDFDKLRGEHEQASSAASAQSSRIASLEQQLEERAKAFKEISHRANQDKEALAIREHKIDSLTATIERLEGTIAERDNQLHAAAEEQRSTEGDLVQSNEQIVALNTRISELEEEKKGLESDLVQTKQDADDTVAKVQTTYGDLNLLTETLTAKRMEEEKLSKVLADKEATIRSRELQFEEGCKRQEEHFAKLKAQHEEACKQQDAAFATRKARHEEAVRQQEAEFETLKAQHLEACQQQEEHFANLQEQHEEAWRRQEEKFASLVAQHAEVIEQQDAELAAMKVEYEHAREEQEAELAHRRAQIEEEHREYEAQLSQEKARIEENYRNHLADFAARTAQLEEERKQQEAELATLKYQHEEACKQQEADFAALTTRHEDACRQQEADFKALTARREAEHEEACRELEFQFNEFKAQLDHSRKQLETKFAADTERRDKECRQHEAAITALKTEQEHARQVLQDLQDAAEENRRLSAELEREGQTRHASIEQQVKAEQENLHKIASGLAASERQRADVEESIKGLGRQKDNLETQLEVLGGKLAKLNAEIEAKSELREELNRVEKRARELEKREEKLSTREMRVKERKEIEQAAEQRIREIEKAVREREKVMAQFQTEADERIKEADRALQKRLLELKMAEDRIHMAEQMDSEIASKQKRLDEMNEKLNDYSDSIQQLQGERKTLEANVKKFQSGVNAGPAPLAKAASRTVVPEDVAAAENRLKEIQQKIEECEDYQRILREALRPDQGTVQVLSHQIIKKLDQLEDLIYRYKKNNRGDVVTQLVSLRDSFQDILSDHSVKAFTFAPGTELDKKRRDRVEIVDTQSVSKNGDSSPHIIETLRPGYVVCENGNGSEKVIRKAEVIAANT